MRQFDSVSGYVARKDKDEEFKDLVDRRDKDNQERNSRLQRGNSKEQKILHQTKNADPEDN